MDDLRSIVSEHISWARQNGLLPREVLESIGADISDEPYPNWDFVRYWLTVMYRRDVLQDMAYRNFQASKAQVRVKSPNARSFRNEMRSLLTGRAA